MKPLLICAYNHYEYQNFISENKLTNTIYVSEVKILYGLRDLDMWCIGRYRERSDLIDILIQCKVRNIHMERKECTT